MRTWARQQRGESDESFAMRKRTRATNELRAILATPEGREALKALLTEDGPTEAAMRASYDEWPQAWGPDGEAKTYEECYGMTPLEHADDVAEMRVAVAAAVNALDSPEGDA